MSGILDLLKDKDPMHAGTTPEADMMLGEITNTNDPEGMGRVKVKIYARSVDENETDWIRVLTPYGGKQRGFYFPPEVGDEVLVAFIGGDIHRPYVLGYVWNSKEMPPAKNEDGKNNIKIIRTRNENKITINDEDGKEGVEILTKKKMSVKLDDEKETITVKGKDGKDVLEIDSSKGTVTLRADVKMILKVGSNTITIDGNANSISMESGSSIKIKSNQITIESGGTLTIKSAGILDVKSDGVTNIKGSVVKIN